MKRLIILFLFITALAFPGVAETVIYDNITTSQYKTIQVDSDLCGVVPCQHSLYLNELFVQHFGDGELLYIPDGSNVTVVIDDPINTNLEDSYDTGKALLTVATMAFIGPVVMFLIVVLLIFWLLRRKRGRG